METRSIAEWQKIVHARNVEKGFYDYKGDLQTVSDFLDAVYKQSDFEGLGGAPVTMKVDLSTYWALARIVKDYSQAQVERKLLLVIGEVCEAHEELRSGHGVREAYFKPGSPENNSIAAKPEGFPVELADAQIRLLDLEASCEIDAEAMMEMKHRYNETRPYKHGRKF